MDRRSSCYLNSAYNRNVDDFDDYIDNESHLSFNSNVGNLSYDSENETFVDAYLFDDRDTCLSDDDQLAAFDQHHIGNRSYSLQQLQRYHLDAYAAAICDAKNSYPERVTSTPKKKQPQQQHQQHQQCLTPSGRKNPLRREAIVRRRSLSSLSYHRAESTQPENSYQRAAVAASIRRSKSSLSLRPRNLLLDQQQQQQQQQQQLLHQTMPSRYAFPTAVATRLNASARYVNGGGGGGGSAGGSGNNSNDMPMSVTTTPTRSSRTNFLNVSEPTLRLSPSISAAVSPFQIRQKSLFQSSAQQQPPPAVKVPLSPLSASNDAQWSFSENRNRSRQDMFTARNPFLRRPYDLLNSSWSSTRPLVSRNTAVISPIYNVKTTASPPSPFDVDHNSRMLSVSAADRSICSSTKTSSSWFQQIRKPRLPLCTLRTSAITLLVSGTLTCLLCIHIISQRGKSYELTFSLISGFVILCLGFPCLRFQEWQWLPNRNYVAGYIILSLFSVLQSAALWILDKYPSMQPELIDLTKGALCGLSSLSLSLATMGVCASCCCKYPPPDNRVNHGVQGFTV